MRTPRRIVIAAILMLSACSGRSEKAALSSTSAATSAPSSAPSTSATQMATTTSTPTTSAPSPTTAAATSTSLVPAGAEDWAAIIQTLGRRRQELYAAPDTSRIAEVCADSTQCFEQLNVQLGDLVSKGWKVVGAEPYVVISATLEKFDGDSLDASLLVTVVVVVQRPSSGGSIVDTAGTEVASVVAETPEGTNTEYRTILARVGPAEDPWRIVSQDRLKDVPA